MPFRKRLRIFTEDRRVEGTIMLIVFVYFIFIVLDFTVPEIVQTIPPNNGLFTQSYQDFIISWTRTFWAIDLLFLSFFLIEIGLRVYAWGAKTYLGELINTLDAIIVLVSFALLWITLEFTWVLQWWLCP